MSLHDKLINNSKLNYVLQIHKLIFCAGDPQPSGVGRRQRSDAAARPNRYPDWRRARRHGHDPFRGQPPGRLSRQVPSRGVTPHRSRLPSQLHVHVRSDRCADAAQTLLPQSVAFGGAEQQLQQAEEQRKETQQHQQDHTEFGQHSAVLLQ